MSTLLDNLDLARRALKLVPLLPELRPTARRTVADLVEERAGQHPDRMLVRYGGADSPARDFTYGEIDAAANRVAWWAVHRGLRPGNVVALLMENRPEYLVTWMGLAKAGVTTALINTNLNGSALRHALSTASTSTLILGSECRDRFATLTEDPAQPLDVWIATDPDDPSPPEAPVAGTTLHDLDADLAQREAQGPDMSLREEIHTGDSLFYIYTSGTTGLPKAAQFSHMRFFATGLTGALGLRLDAGDVHYCALPLYHSAGGAMLVGAALHAGATIALRRRFSASAFWDDCRRFGATHFQYIGEFCRYLLNQPPRDDDRDHGVHTVIGNGLRPDIWEEFQQRFGLRRIIEFYGATEGNMAFANFSGRPGYVGRMPFGRLGRRLGQAKIIRYDHDRNEPVRDARGRCVECDPDQPGELIARISENRALGRFEGYTSKEATEKKVLRDAFRPGDAWFRSGDLLRMDADGWLTFVDRVGDTFRWKGENVSTQEVAEIVSGYPGLSMVNVYGIGIEGQDGRAGAAALVVEGGAAKFDAAAFFAFTREKLPAYAAPVFVRLIDEPEITGTFKLRKVTLQEEGFDPDRVTDPMFVRDSGGGTYVPLTPAIRKQILSGDWRL